MSKQPCMCLCLFLSSGAFWGCGSEGAELPTAGGGATSDGGGGRGASGGTGEAITEEPWDSVQVPEPTGSVSPLSCETLTGDNCWKAAADSIVACAPTGEGTISEDGMRCTFPNGASLRFASSILTMGGYTFVEHTLIGADGEECLAYKGVAWGDAALRSPGSTVLYDSLSASSVRIVCSDGTSLNSEQGSCEDIDVPLEARPSYYIWGSVDQKPFVFTGNLYGSSSLQEEKIWRCVGGEE